MNPRAYLETSLISYLVGRPSRDVIVLGNQELTREWWHSRRNAYDLYVSEIVIREASLLTWICSHIANAVIRRAVERQCRAAGYEPPVICTPQELEA